MSDLERFSRIVRHVYAEPKFRAEMEWHCEYGIGAQLGSQWPREEMELFATTGQHKNPEREISLVLHEMPDFDWWEPRYDQPGRRELARNREAGFA